MFSFLSLVLPAQAQELASLGDKGSQVKGQVTVVGDLKAEVEELKGENTGTGLSEALLK